MNIGELMKKSKVSRKTIYFYESKGMLKPIKKENGYREYNDNDLKKLNLIIQMRKLDLPLSLINKILNQPEHVDILLQAYLNQKKKELFKLKTTFEQLKEIIQTLPPNGTLHDFNEIATSVQELEEQTSENQLNVEEYNRRICMNTFEAFLIYPLNTIDKKEKWNQILNQHKAKITKNLIAAYTKFYGFYSIDDFELDFQERRKRVLEVAHYDKLKYDELALQIIGNMKYQQSNPILANLWKAYCESYVSEMDSFYKNHEKITITINELTDIMMLYQQAMSCILPIVKKLSIKEDLNFELWQEVLNSENIFQYFDFYTHSYLKVYLSHEKL